MLSSLLQIKEAQAEKYNEIHKLMEEAHKKKIEVDSMAPGRPLSVGSERTGMCLCE